MGGGIGRLTDSQVDKINSLGERVAVMDQKVSSALDNQQKDSIALKSYIDERFERQKVDMQVYIDRKFTDIGNTIRTTPTAAMIDPRFWWLVAAIGVFSAGTFIAFSIYLLTSR